MSKLRISLAAARVNAGLTQHEVAQKLHVSNKTIVNWENGKARPSFAVITMLSDIYDIPVNYIFLPEKST